MASMSRSSRERQTRSDAEVAPLLVSAWAMAGGVRAQGTGSDLATWEMRPPRRSRAT